MEKTEYDEIEKTYEEVKTIKKEVRTDSYFDGKFIEYIGYQILAFLITVVTLTIAKPWADKLILDYKINHTNYNGKRLKFEGKGTNLFIQRFKWALLTIITLGIYSFWVPIKMEKWVVSNLHFEDEEFNENESFFDGKLIHLIGINLFTYLITLISFGLLFPFAICYRQKWIARHTIINRKKIIFSGKATSLIGHYLLWWFLSIITLGIYALWLPIKVYEWQVKNTHIKLKDEQEEKSSMVPAILGVIISVVIVAVIGLIISKIDWNKIPDVFNRNSKEIIDTEYNCPLDTVYLYEFKKCSYIVEKSRDECNAIKGFPYTRVGKEMCTIFVDPIE